MSFTDGIGNLQQAVSSITPSEAKPAASASDNGTIEQPVANVEHGDQTSLSSTGGLVAQALETSDVRSEKIASLQQAIATNNYSVSASDLADKIIQSLLD